MFNKIIPKKQWPFVGSEAGNLLGGWRTDDKIQEINDQAFEEYCNLLNRYFLEQNMDYYEAKQLAEEFAMPYLIGGLRGALSVEMWRNQNQALEIEGLLKLKHLE